MKLLALALLLVGASNVVAVPERIVQRVPTAESDSSDLVSRATITVQIFTDAFFKGSSSAFMTSSGSCSKPLHFDGLLLLNSPLVAIDVFFSHC